MPSIEEKVEDHFKKQLDALQIRRYTKTEAINPSIKRALEREKSKSGGMGGNFPDIQIFLDNGRGRRIPVMMEAKGAKNRLENSQKAAASRKMKKPCKATPLTARCTTAWRFSEASTIYKKLSSSA